MRILGTPNPSVVPIHNTGHRESCLIAENKMLKKLFIRIDLGWNVLANSICFGLLYGLIFWSFSVLYVYT